MELQFGRVSISVVSIFVTATVAVLLAACSSQPSESIVGTNTTDLSKATVASRDMNRYPMNKVICDPLEGGGVPTPPPPQNGIAAELAYLPPATSPFENSGDYFIRGMRSTQQLFFQDLFVPTRLFQEGFSTQTSDVIRNDMGEKLIENFGLRFKTTLKLVGEQTDGNYEFAVLSDDGVTVKAVSGEQKQTLIDNDGVHPTRMGCASTTLSLSKTAGQDFEITYHQGPRYHISLVMLWRKATSTKTKADVNCGVTGNNTWFDPDHGSTPQKAYKDLLARGWAPIPKANYFLPAVEDINPCTPGSPLAITDFKMTGSGKNQISVGWTTNRPATTQALVTNRATGEQFLTISDQTLTTAHGLTISGLTTGGIYDINALSVAEDGGRAMSQTMTVEVPDIVVCQSLNCTIR